MYRNLARSFSLLSINNFVTIGLSLLVLPYLTRSLGLIEFGSFSLIIASSYLLTNVVEYGFTYTSVQTIAKNKIDKSALSMHYLSMLCIQLFILILSLIIIYFVNLFILSKIYNTNHLLYIALLSFANVFNPNYFLIGIEKFGLILINNIFSKGIILFCIIISGGHNLDTVLLIYIFINLFTYITVSLYSILKYTEVTFPSLCFIYSQFRFNFNFFISKILITSYTTFTPILIGMISGASALSIFNVADKARGAAQSTITPITQVFTPKIISNYRDNFSNSLALIKKSIYISLSFSLAISVLLWVASPLIIYLLAGNDYNDAIRVLKILSLLPPIVTLSNIFGFQIILPNGLGREFNWILSLASFSFLAMSIPLIYYYSAVGAAYSLLLTELLITSFMALLVYKRLYNSLV